jgi:cytochrome c oxidase assembly factor CtaG
VLILGGLLFWWPLVSGRLSPPPALAYLGAGFVLSSFLGLALIFSSRPFYSYYEHTRASGDSHRYATRTSAAS